jgi:hypothetical protein
MLRRRRQWAALFVLGGAVGPWLAAALVALHMESHSGGHDGGDRESSGLAAVLHGHHHERGTPDHQHLLTLPGGAPPPARATLAPVPAVFADVPSRVAATMVRFAAGVSSVGHDPPSAERSFRILRI